MESIKSHMDNLDEEERAASVANVKQQKEEAEKIKREERVKQINDEIEALENDPKVIKYLELKKELLSLKPRVLDVDRITRLGPSSSLADPL